MFAALTLDGVVWADGSTLAVDTIIWCTGFRPAPSHQAGLGRTPADDTQARDEPRLHLLGYGDWTGPASATLIGVGRTARTAVAQILGRLERHDDADPAAPGSRRTG
jgi:putative flavoprotein involved in K+ transport